MKFIYKTIIFMCLGLCYLSCNSEDHITGPDLPGGDPFTPKILEFTVAGTRLTIKIVGFVESCNNGNCTNGWCNNVLVPCSTPLVWMGLHPDFTHMPPNWGNICVDPYNGPFWNLGFEGMEIRGAHKEGDALIVDVPGAESCTSYEFIIEGC